MLFFSYWPEPGLLYTIYLLLIYMGLVVYSLFLLHRSYLSSSGERRGQILYVIVGAIIGFGGGLTNFFLWYDIPIAPYGNFLVAFFPFFLGYAILKHHLFNVKVIATELMTFVIWTAIFVEMLEADTFKERVFEIGLLVFVVFFGILLIRSVLRLEETNVRLKQLDKLKSEFLSFASHQIKAPMTVIKGYASLISEGSYGPIPEKAKEGSAHIKEVADRLIGLVDDFLNLRRIEEGRMEYQFGKTNIVDLVDSVANDFMILAQNKKLDLTFKGPGHEIIVKADREKLRQVIQNLIENAIKYTDKGFVRVELKEKKDSVLIAVSDTGLGISKKLLPNLFQQFSRDPATAGKIEGTGLGLYIAREIIRAHNGKIWAESNGEDKGATFYVELAKKVDLPEGEHVDIALKL
jgi:signal transduction histidine kinase